MKITVWCSPQMMCSINVYNKGMRRNLYVSFLLIIIDVFSDDCVSSNTQRETKRRHWWFCNRRKTDLTLTTQAAICSVGACVTLRQKNSNYMFSQWGETVGIQHLLISSISTWTTTAAQQQKGKSTVEEKHKQLSCRSGFEITFVSEREWKQILQEKCLTSFSASLFHRGQDIKTIVKDFVRVLVWICKPLLVPNRTRWQCSGSCAACPWWLTSCSAC